MSHKPQLQEYPRPATVYADAFMQSRDNIQKLKQVSKDDLINRKFSRILPKNPKMAQI